MIFNVEVYGQIKINETFDSFTLAVRDQMLKKAVREVLVPMRDAAKRAVKERTGALRGSIDIKVSAKGAKGFQVYAVMGPKTGVRVPVKLITRGVNKGKVLIAIPTRYAHLVEFGHRLFLNGKFIGNVPPKPFMRTAWAQFGGNTAILAFEGILARLIADWIANLSTTP